MEQFWKNFFDDNSVCIGLCDLKRRHKAAESSSTENTLAQPTVEFTQQQAYQQQLSQALSAAQQLVQQNIQQPVLKQVFNFTQKPQPVEQKVEIKKPVEMKTTQPKPQRQTLAERFAAQQREFAAQQAFLAEQKKRAAQQQAEAQKTFIEEARAAQQAKALQPAKVQQKYEAPVAVKPLFVAQQEFEIDGKSYIQYGSRKVQEPKIIVNGNMKKVVSAAVPVRYHL